MPQTHPRIIPPCFRSLHDGTSQINPLRFASEHCDALRGFSAVGLVNDVGYASDDAKKPAALIDGTGPDWKALGQDDFVNVNCDEDTWSFPNGEIHCTGNPVGVMRTKKELTNFELVVEWRHLKSAGTPACSFGQRSSRYRR